MADLSYLVTWRDDGTAARRANLAAVLAWVRSLPDVEPVVVEQDDEPRAGPALRDGARWVFCHNPGPFNKSWGLNVGARMTRAPLLAFGDADVICARTWSRTVDSLRERAAIAKPYSHLIDLTEEESARVRAGQWTFQPQRAAGAPPNREGQGEFVVYAGGLFLLRREVFEQVGGFDERFLGWGGEDDAMTMRLMATGRPWVIQEGSPALHLWHPRSLATTFQQPHYAANCALLADYRRGGAALCARLADLQRPTLGVTPPANSA